MNTIWQLTRLAVPVNEDRGVDSPVSAHFGKAPGFLLIHSDGSSPVFYGSAALRQHSECAPIYALSRMGVRVVVARSMGRGALQRCHEAGLEMLRSDAETVAHLLADYRNGDCIDFPDTALCDHSHDDSNHCHSHG